MKLIKEIRSKEGILHFRRWNILSTKWFCIYLHGIYMHDLEEHLHDHPWDFTSIILKGSYTERLKAGESEFIGGWIYMDTVREPFSIAKRKAEDFHKILHLNTKKVYTLVIAKRRRREWGYDMEPKKLNGRWVDNQTYRFLKNTGNL